MGGLEPPTTRFQGEYATTALHPEKLVSASGFEPEQPASHTGVLPLHYDTEKLAVGNGFEPLTCGLTIR